MLDMSLFSRAHLEASIASRPEERQERDMHGDGAADDLFDPGNAGAPAQDFFDDGGNDFDHGNADGGFGMDNDGGGMMGGHEGYGGASDSDNDGDGQDGPEGYVQGQGAQHGLGNVQRFDPRLNPDQREVVIGMGGEEGDKKVFSYFDSTLSKNLAGPEHWKMRKTVRKAAQDEKAEEEQAAGGKGKRTAKKPAKEPFKIDFSADTPAPETKKLFVSSNASITLPIAKKQKRRALQEKREDYLLPDDMHFSSQQLLRLFLKPKAAVSFVSGRLAFDADVVCGRSTCGGVCKGKWGSQQMVKSTSTIGQQLRKLHRLLEAQTMTMMTTMTLLLYLSTLNSSMIMMTCPTSKRTCRWAVMNLREQ